MTRQTVLPVLAFALAMLIVSLAGCRSRARPPVARQVSIPESPTRIVGVSHNNGEVGFGCGDECLDEIERARPHTNRTVLPDKYWPLSLREAIHIALQDTEVLRSLGANIVLNPASAQSNYDPAIQFFDPNYGVEAALAQYDARINSSLLYARNDDVFNNTILGGGAVEVRDDVATADWNLSRTTPLGTQFSFGSRIAHSQTDNPNVLFPHSWTTLFQATARQPLLQGRGTRFNSIVGPATQPGIRNSTGILLSRLNHEISVAQFQANVNGMLQEIVDAYWQLSAAHQNFEAIREVYNSGVEIWKIAKSRFENDLKGGEADREAQAREQMFELQGRLLTSINGDRQTGQSGVLQAEANLRRLLNLPQVDERLIVTSDAPASVETVFDWQDLAHFAISSRFEIHRQRLRVKQRQLELEAARNFTLPRLDALATYRNNGFGDDLAFAGGGRFASALGDAVSNDHGEWELGLLYDVPVGFRQACSGVRNAELALCREQAVFREQRRQILHDLGSAFRQVDQNYSNINYQFNRLEAAQATVDARTAAYEADAVGFDELLQAQLRLLSSKLSYIQTMANYEAAKEQLLLESGQLYHQHGLVISEH